MMLCNVVQLMKTIWRPNFITIYCIGQKLVIEEMVIIIEDSPWYLQNDAVKHLRRVSSDDQKSICFREIRSQREHIFKNLHYPTREWVKEQVSEALRSEWAEWAVRTNKHSKQTSSLLKTRFSVTQTPPLKMLKNLTCGVIVSHAMHLTTRQSQQSFSTMPYWRPANQY